MDAHHEGGGVSGDPSWGFGVDPHSRGGRRTPTTLHPPIIAHTGTRPADLSCPRDGVLS